MTQETDILLRERHFSLRRPRTKDIDAIEQFAVEALPGEFVEAAIVEVEDGIIAFGAIRSNLEAILYPTGSIREKVQALKLLLEQAEKDTLKYGYKYLDVNARDEAFAQILIKHFGFERVSGVPLIKRLK